MTLPDQEARERALDHTQSFIVQAPAGSGKTGLLVRRILCLLQIVEKPEEILAITFTRKATAEMRDRVISTLRKVNEGSQFEDHEQDLRPLAEAVLARDKNKQWKLLTNSARLRISTIDALSADLVRKMPWSSRFGSTPQIEADSENLYLQAAHNLLQKIEDESYQPSLACLLMHCNGDMNDLKSTLANTLSSREDWLRMIFHDEALESRKALSKHWHMLNRIIIDSLEQHLGQQTCDDLLSLARYAAHNRPENQPPISKPILAALEHPYKNIDDQIRFLRWHAITPLLVTKTRGLLTTRSVNKTIGFPIKDSAKAQLIEILSAHTDDTELFRLLCEFRNLPDSEINDTEWQRLSALKTILPLLAQELYVLMAERNCSDYIELSQRAIVALGELDDPTDLALVQDYSLSHILMDEFQDTSPTQLELLKRLCAGWQQNDGRTLFMVGDPMQSIYAFRKADVRVFLSVRTNGINDIRLVPLELTVNFRSSPTLVNWVNRTMKSVFPDKNIPELAKVKYSKSLAFHKFKGAVQSYLSVANSPDSETAQILELVHAILAQGPQPEIAILARKRTPLARIATALRDAGLAFESVELETLAEQIVVQDLISLSAVFLQPMSTLAWLSVMRAPWCGLNLKDLTALRQSNQSIISLLEQSEEIENLSRKGALKLESLRSGLLPMLAEGERSSFTDRVYRAWLRLRAPACYSATAQPYAERYFELLNTLESKPEPLNQADILRACQKHKTSSPNASIKLMTLHKAKGLEFEHVLLADLAGKPGGDNRQQTLFASTKIGQQWLVAPSARADEPKPNKSDFIRQYLKSIENEEAARLLYVAVTRAKSNLYLFATLKRSKSGNIGIPQQGSLLSLLWPACQNSFEESKFLVDASSPHDDQAQPEPARPSIPLLSLPTEMGSVELPRAISFSPLEASTTKEQLEFDWAQEDTRIIGLTVHHFLQFTDTERLKSWQKKIDPTTIRSSLIRFGLSTDRIESACHRVISILKTMSNHSRAYWLFDSAHREIKSEWALSYHRNGKVENYVVDRSFIDQTGIRWIIDFKTGSHQGGDTETFLDQEEKRHAAQLNQYAALVRALDSKHEIRLGLYFPAIGQWRERVSSV